MPTTSRSVIALCCLIPALFTACRRETASRTTCASTIHGFTAPVADPHGPDPRTCTHGVVNPATAVMATSGSFSGFTYGSQRGTYNSSDNCYYVFGSTGVYPTDTRYLYRIAAGGVTTAFAGPDTTRYSGIVYNPSNSKLYCTGSGTLEEIALSGSTFSTTVVATPAHWISYSNYSYSNITVNRSTGDIYFISRDFSGSYLQKYHPGSSGTTELLLSPFTRDNPREVRYNQNDNMLYALQRDTTLTVCDFLKIDPLTGSIATVAHLGSRIDYSSFSGTLDECTNQYIVSTAFRNDTGGVPGWIPILYQLDMSGTILQTDTVASIYQGLDVQY